MGGSQHLYNAVLPLLIVFFLNSVWSLFTTSINHRYIVQIRLIYDLFQKLMLAVQI